MPMCPPRSDNRTPLGLPRQIVAMRRAQSVPPHREIHVANATQPPSRTDRRRDRVRATQDERRNRRRAELVEKTAQLKALLRVERDVTHKPAVYGAVTTS
jgi:hypothetical protein